MSTLFIVATPIGNLEDMTIRAINTLKSVDWIAAEDTRHSQKLLQHYQISQKLMSYHEHNERDSVMSIIQKLKSGQTVALISDAGTPLISDPGYLLVRAAYENHIKVVPVPGSCAAIAALSASGLSNIRFVFEGFLPSAVQARKTKLESLKLEKGTLIFYEAPHRLVSTLKDMASIFGKEREVVIARELTKTFETIIKAPLEKLVDIVTKDSDQSKGECVLLVSGMSDEEEKKYRFISAKEMLNILLNELPLKKAVKITAKLTQVSKNSLYETALTIKNSESMI